MYLPKTKNVFLFKPDYFTDLLGSAAQQRAKSAQPKEMKPRAGGWEQLAWHEGKQHEHLKLSFLLRDS